MKIRLRYIVLVAVLMAVAALVNRLANPAPEAAPLHNAPALLGPAEAPLPPLQYIEVTQSCNYAYEGVCVNARSGPGKEYPVVLRLRTGVVLKTTGLEQGGSRLWYRAAFDEWLRYPERAPEALYIASEYVRAFADPGPQELAQGAVATTTKWILVDRSEQMLYAYEGGLLFMQEPISTGLEFTPTPRGTFAVYKKTPSRYMQGPIEGITEKEYDVPGVPWNLYFTAQGAVIHGAYWHDHFGQQWSNGCVNLPPDKARALYEWADLGTRVVVQD